MQIDPRLNDIDDCLYRVAIRALVVRNNKVLLVQETPELWWAFPGGGVDHGETVESCLTREVAEELGVPAGAVSFDPAIAHYTIGRVVNGVPRMNLFFNVSVPENLLQKTTQVATWQWFTKEQFMELNIHASYDKTDLLAIIFDK